MSDEEVGLMNFDEWFADWVKAAPEWNDAAGNYETIAAEAWEYQERKLAELRERAADLSMRAMVESDDAGLVQEARDAVVQYNACLDDRGLVQGHLAWCKAITGAKKTAAKNTKRHEKHQ